MISHTSFSDRRFHASHARQSAVVLAKKVFTSRPRLRPENLQVMLVVHHAKDVPEWIDHRCGDESGSALDRLLVHRGAHGPQPLEAGPVSRPSTRVRATRRKVARTYFEDRHPPSGLP